MVSSEVPSSPSPPPLGTLIDDDTLELVEVLGYGGYGVVYRAVDVYSQEPISYAVKCLPHSSKRNATRQRQLHLREITLHQLASAHSNVVTLHRVIEDPQYTYIVMDYCEDGDLFSQILHHRRYLGNNELIKEVFLQLLDAVDYCHALHIYHRDLKPENVLCFDGGLRLAITDFGLATTESVSTEFRTGSVYHMSPGQHNTPFIMSLILNVLQSVRAASSRRRELTLPSSMTYGHSVSSFSTSLLGGIHGSRLQQTTARSRRIFVTLSTSSPPCSPSQRRSTCF